MGVGEGLKGKDEGLSREGRWVRGLRIGEGEGIRERI